MEKFTMNTRVYPFHILSVLKILTSQSQSDLTILRSVIRVTHEFTATLLVSANNVITLHYLKNWQISLIKQDQ